MKFDRERAARILAAAALVGDKRAAQENGVTQRSLQNWRKRLASDADFSRSFVEKRNLVERDWAESLPGAIRQSIDFLQRAADEADPKDPGVIHSVAGSLKILTDVATTRRLIDARLARQAGPAGPAGPAPRPASSASGEHERVEH
jgi:hypothetical protein